jgi:phenylacetate-coenzyme A ligase PaaK-like adenylate-forming protein
MGQFTSAEPEDLKKSVFQSGDLVHFNETALRIFHYQYLNNEIYRTFCDLLGKGPDLVSRLEDIPFLPISFFKDHQIVTGPADKIQKVFISSGTTGMVPSRHFVTDLKVYEQSFSMGFEYFYGPVQDYCFLALLPGYLERPGSSLIYMMEHLIKMTANNGSGFYLHNHEELYDKLLQLGKKGQKTILIGVSFGLLDFIEKHTIDFPELMVMETGGMKGRRREMVREELHKILCKAFGVSGIHSEYGMTELLSQAWSKGDGIFQCPPWMRILTRDVNDPLSLAGEGKSGGVNIIDLANIYSCSFIATQDLGKLNDDGSFEILGRFDDSEVRGCNLLVS